MKVVIEKIKSIRKQKGYSHEYMAYQLGISQVAYSKIEKNETKLSVDRLIKIAKILETPVVYLLDFNIDTTYESEIQLILYKDSKENFFLMESLYKERLKDKDNMIEQMKRTIDKLL